MSAPLIIAKRVAPVVLGLIGFILIGAAVLVLVMETKKVKDPETNEERRKIPWKKALILAFVGSIVLFIRNLVNKL